MHAKRNRAVVFLASFFFSIHLALVSYVNSSMLGAYVDSTLVSVLFAVGSCFSILLVLFAPKVMHRFGTVRSSVALFLFTALLLWVLGTAHLPLLILVAFVGYFSLTAVVFYTIDIFIEHYSTDTKTGNIRGLSLTINNLAWVAMPILVGSISVRYGFAAVYLLAAIAVALAGVIIAISQRTFVERPPTTTNLVAAFAHVRRTPALRRIISINFLLQFFYSWMVIYVPLYLATIRGLSWTTIGAIISITLIPFVLLQYPAGRIADRRLGEKELIISGLIIMAIATVAFALLDTATVAVLATALFCTRIGASVVEVMSDSYFFKQVNDSQTEAISLYRTMQPFAYIVGPIAGAVLLFFVSYTTLFIVLGIVLVAGALYALRIVDTR